MEIFIDESGIRKSVDNSVFVLVYVEIEDYKGIEEKMLRLERKIEIVVR